jgi:hypothetical protein
MPELLYKLSEYYVYISLILNTDIILSTGAMVNLGHSMEIFNESDN